MAKKVKEFTYKGVSTREAARWPTREDRAIAHPEPIHVLSKDWDIGNNVGVVEAGGYFLLQVNSDYAVFDKNHNRSHVSVTETLLNEIIAQDNDLPQTNHIL